MRMAVAAALVLSAQTCPAAGFRERVEAAAAARYDGIGLRPRDLRAARAEGFAGPAARRLVEEHGLRVVELEALFDWALGGERGAASRRFEERLYEVAGAVVGDYLLVNSELDAPVELAGERLAALCEMRSPTGSGSPSSSCRGPRSPTSRRVWRSWRRRGTRAPVSS